MRLFRSLDGILALLLAYIGVRLLTPFEAPWQWAGAALLALLFLLLPRSWWVRDDGRAWKVMVPWVATGFASWLLVLTFARDLALLAAGFLLDERSAESLARQSALAVAGLTPA